MTGLNVAQIETRLRPELTTLLAHHNATRDARKTVTTCITCARG